MQIVSEIPYPVHWLTHEVAMAPALHPEAEAAEHAMPLNLRFRCPPHRRCAPRPTPASTMVPHPAWSWTPPRSCQPEAPVPFAATLCIVSCLMTERQYGHAQRWLPTTPQPHTPPPKKPDTSRRPPWHRLPPVQHHRATDLCVHRGATSNPGTPWRPATCSPHCACGSCSDWCRCRRPRMPRRRS